MPDSPDLRCDVAVIGAGTAGMSAERAARDAGASTLLIDPEFRGTLCANTGCMPSKLLLAAAHAAHDARRAPVFGVHPGTPRIDGPAVMQRLREERDRFVQGTRESYDDLPEGVMVRATAQFAAPNRLILSDGRHVEARAVVIATGSANAIPGPFEDLGDRMLTNETVFEIEDLPNSLAVIGAGAIGCELAQGMARLGVAVSLFDHGTSVGKARCPRVGRALEQALARDVDLHLGVETEARAEGFGLRLSWKSEDDSGEEYFDRVLVAAGRPPNLKGLSLEHSGLDLDDKGMPDFDRRTMRCRDSAIFIAGDANADAPFLHEASTEGAVAGRNAANLPRISPADRSPAFALTFTDPPMAVIGVAPEEGRICGSSDYGDQGRAKVEAINEGLMRIYADDQGRLTGADLCCPGGDMLAHILAWAIQSGATAPQLLAMPFYHPTLVEGMKPALREICAQVDAPQPSDRDFGTPPGA
ncbi:dihydrolipoyl dehydrogenase [Paracoccus sp. 1_MG-2023]|uniref:dihydrolipoyl dehydrogenase n=1 Tax=unclassified Paracoccus (in: a-proteobacteria) TaxID=2688777 RepID=UPI001C0A514C|nr:MULTISPECIES: dihydrolipoyl dehydrogenase [unclassified Paracoccus (in: a-proteobacteria)]MBU2957800.1 dihydrolipoyl dehydrogenase [Paracoccus sp. C2R09]MDO6667351.1 dihydrolipoyl dehydrogenase [Paracoccus sp. 1_MG-2023]